MHKYTLAFLKRGNEILLINRHKAPWLGSWNGVGGKIDKDEQIFDSMIREIKEETDISLTHKQLKYCGTVTWDAFDAQGTGLYLFIADVGDCQLETPIATDEGILDWKTLDWINDKNNTGIAHNIPYFLNHAMHSTKIHEYYCKFEGDRLIEVKIIEEK